MKKNKEVTDSAWFIKQGLWVAEWREMDDEGILYKGTEFWTVNMLHKYYRTTMLFNKWEKLPIKEKEKWCKMVKRII